MIRTDEWKYIHRLHDIDELYNLDADPGEERNVIDVLDNQEVVQELSKRLLSWFVETGDVVPPHPKDTR